ncbi:acyl-CoA oxidase [Acrasis kona]|uniref:Acyl-coenzyme A oxidase n=1 Tax=Acrasis kona TaxID=1008807 RepID=A0AAW2ZJV4_9EUKA
MKDTSLNRISILRSHLVHDNSSNNDHVVMEECKAIGRSMIPTSLSAEDVKVLLNDFVQDHSDLRKRMFEWFEQNRSEFQIRSGCGDGDLDFIRRRGHEQACKILKQNFITVEDIINDPTKVFAFFESLTCDGSVNVKLSVHYNLFGACIAHLGTKKHHEKKGDQVGCFLMSELAHASNLRNLGTTITYDPITKDLVINTPDDASQKYWIGNAFVSAKIGVIFGQLITNGTNQGVHAFIVHLRDENHILYEGIKIKDVGVKLGLNAVDNGRVWFDQYHIPIDALLDRYAQIDANTGRYTSSIKSNNLKFAKHIGALLQARLGVGSGSVITSRLSLSIALRYAYKRRQFGPPGQEEVPIITYRIHQRRLIPLLSTSYAITFFNNLCKREYASVTGNHDDSYKDEDSLKKLHLLASATKAYCSWLALDHIQMAREATGGQGYLTRNIISIMLTDTNVSVTLDGDNYLLMQQISQVLLSNYAKKFEEKNSDRVYLPGGAMARNMIYLGKEKVKDATRNGLITNLMNVNESYLTSGDFLLNCFQFKQDRLLHTLAKRLYNAVKTVKLQKPHLDKKVAGFEAYNSVQDHSLNLARAYCENQITIEFFNVIEKMKNKLGANHHVVRVMNTLCVLHALDRMERNSSWFLETRSISSAQIKKIRCLINEICSDLVPVVPSLIDSWGIPEFVLDETIASSKYDNVELNKYENEFSM